MTIRGILDHVDRVLPNAFSDEDKLLWLNELETAIQADVLGLTDDFETHVLEDAEEDEPIAPEPYQKLYYTYLMARIDAANGEWTEYDNAMALYNGFLGEFQRYYARNYVDNPETRDE